MLKLPLIFFTLIQFHGVSEGKSWISNLSTFDTSAKSIYKTLRTTIHIHSLFSHDACDSEPIKKGIPNIKCLLSFRKALCDNHEDVVFLTEHRNSMAFTDFNQLLNPQPGDQLIYDGNYIIGSIQNCEDGHQVRVYPGSENNLMTLGLLHHPEIINQDLEHTYNEGSPKAVDNFRQSGALVAINHPEKRTLENIQKLHPDLLEIYNLHANIEDVIRENKFGKAFLELMRLINFFSNPLQESDLSFLSFFRENSGYLKKWSQLVIHQKLPGILALDCHENALKLPMHDGKRIDSYRRTSRWLSNFIRIKNDEIDRGHILKSLHDGLSYSGFEIFGSPYGFIFEAIDNDGITYEMGDSINFNKFKRLNLEVNLNINEIFRMYSKIPPYEIQIFKASESGWLKVGSAHEFPYFFEVKEPGVYRSEIRIIPSHLKNLIPLSPFLIHQYPWIYSNPIYIL